MLFRSAGILDEIGAGAETDLAVGEDVMAIVSPAAAHGAYSEYVVLPAESVVRVPAGIDGEAVHLDPPLRFSIRHRALRVRIAPGHPGVSPTAVVPDKPWGLLHALAHVAFRGASPRQ